MSMPDAVGESANDRSYRHISEGILTGRLPGGSMLSEAALAAELGLSRTPIRAALLRLQEEGWVTIYPKRGALVQSLSQRDIAELAATKSLLESGAVRMARPDVLVDLATTLRPELKHQHEALSHGDLSSFVQLSTTFHRSFIVAAHNHMLAELYDRLADRQRFVMFTHRDHILDRASNIIDEHEQMIEAIATGDDTAFATVLRSHVIGGPTDTAPGP